MALDETLRAPGDRRYVIVGAGAIGGTVGAVLARAGIPTVLVARGRHAETLAAEGLTLRTPDGTFHTPVAAVSQAEQLRLTPHDVLIFTTKTQQLDAALQEWVDQPVHGSGGVVGTAGELLPVMTALNGVAAEEKALRYFRSVFGICVWLPAVHLEPGEVIVRSWPVVGQFHIGRWPAQLRTPADAELLRGLTETWIVAGIRVRAVDDVTPWKYNKLLSNLGNAVGALSAEGADVGQVVAAVRDEGEQVLRYAGIEFVSFEVSTAARVDGPTPRPVPGRNTGASNSTWQSLSRNTGNVETDYFNGEIVRLAHRHGIAAPVNGALARAARAAVRNEHGPSRYSADATD
ncbi:MAG: 2-dehydropantoate 2-reductase N-terminal domain-containing protein [Mycobacterium sp.]|uniref:ketopantoate reductase family protein n=1 Tax=Mycobacterium sp. TaxID=1785 RepID=UPI003BB57654